MCKTKEVILDSCLLMILLLEYTQNIEVCLKMFKLILQGEVYKKNINNIYLTMFKKKASQLLR